MDLMDYRRKIIANSPHLSSASGAVATFSDGTDLPLKSLLVDIEPVQSGSGDPSPTNIRPISGWNAVKVTRCGKNVFDNQFSNRTINGLTWVLNSDGTITVNGTATAETQLHTQFVSGIEGECYFSGCPSGGSSTSYDVFIWDVTNSRRAKKWDRTTTVDSELGEGNAQVYLEKGVTYRFCYRIRNGYTANNVLFSPMIRLASDTDGTYEPYNGVTILCGKNLLHITCTSTTVSGVTFTVNSDGTIGVNGTATANVDFSVYSSASDGGMVGSYILSSDVINSANTYKLVGRVTNTSTSARRYINTKDGEMLIATGENEIIDRIYINVQSGITVNNVVFKPMLRLSSVSDSTYEPYVGTIYGATINPLTGVMTVDRLGVPMESLTWYRSTSYANPIFYTTITGKASDYRKSACSILRNIGSSTIIAAKGFANQSSDGDFASSNANAQIYARLDSATTVQEFVTAVTGQTIVYPLATPITIQLTPHQIRSLYGNNTIFADTGNVALEYWAHP